MSFKKIVAGIMALSMIGGMVSMSLPTQGIVASAEEVDVLMDADLDEEEPEPEPEPEEAQEDIVEELIPDDDAEYEEGEVEVIDDDVIDDGFFEYNENSDGTLSITGYAGISGDIVIPNEINGKTVTRIEYLADYWCSVDTDIDFGDPDGQMFTSEDVTSVYVPNTVTEIAESAFAGATKLISVTFEDDSTLKTIGDGAFYRCDSLEIIIPDSVTDLGTDIFGEEEGISNDATLKISAPCTLDDYFGAEEIRNYKTYYHVTDYSASESYEDNGDDTHKVYCVCGATGSDETHTYDEDGVCICGAVEVKEPVVTPENATPASSFEYTESNGEITITKYIGTDTDVVIPKTIDGIPVTVIGNLAFKSSKIKTLIIPNSVKTIGKSAFYMCMRLNSIDISNSVTTIGGAAFDYTPNLRNIVIPNSVKNIEVLFFQGNLGKNVTAPCTLKSTANKWAMGYKIVVTYTHPVTYKDNGDETHSVKCTCGEVNENEVHNYDNYVCTLCGAKAKPTVTITPATNKKFYVGNEVSSEDFDITATFEDEVVEGTVEWAAVEGGLQKGTNTLTWKFIPNNKNMDTVEGEINVDAETVPVKEKTDATAFAPEGGIKCGTVYDLSEYNCKNISGVEITFKGEVSKNCNGAVVIGNYVVTQLLNSETITDNKISFTVDQYALTSGSNTLAIYNYYDLPEVESVTFYYMDEDTFTTPDNAVVVDNANNNVFDLSAYDYKNVTSVTLVFDDIVYSGGGALVTSDWQNYTFNMKRENSNYITIDVKNLTDTLTFNNYWNLANLDYIVLNGISEQIEDKADTIGIGTEFTISLSFSSEDMVDMGDYYYNIPDGSRNVYYRNCCKSLISFAGWGDDNTFDILIDSETGEWTVDGASLWASSSKSQVYGEYEYYGDFNTNFPTGLKIVSGTGTKEDPFTLELVY